MEVTGLLFPIDVTGLLNAYRIRRVTIQLLGLHYIHLLGLLIVLALEHAKATPWLECFSSIRSTVVADKEYLYLFLLLCTLYTIYGAAKDKGTTLTRYGKCFQSSQTTHP